MALLSTTSSTTWASSSSSSSLPRCALASTPFVLTSFTSFQVSSLLQTKTLNRLGTIFQDLYNHQQPACDSSHRWISSIQVSSPTTTTTTVQPLISATQSQQQFKPQQVSLRYEIKGFYCQTCHGGAMASLFADRATNNPQRRTHQEDMIFETDYSMRQVNVDNNNNNNVIRRIGTRGGTKKPVTSSNTNKKKKKKPKPTVPVKDPCTACNSSIPFITESRFQELYAVAIDKAIANGTIQGIDGMGGFVEVQSIACVATVSNFSSTVFMEFSGDPSAVSGPEVRALEGGFGGTYNDLQGLFCDDQQRKVGNTAFQLISARRLQQRRTATTSSSFKLRVTYRVDVNGTCRGCAKRNTKLFGNDAVKRKLGASVRSYPIHWRTLADSSCTCTSDSIELNGIRAPAEDEFVVAYNETVTDLAEQGILKNVGGVTGASQATTVDCPAKLDKFSVTTFVTLSGNPSLIELREVLLLESGFTGSYNNLQENYCDQQFRSVTNTTFTMSSARRLGSFERATSSQNLKLLVTYRADVNGTCRGCPKKVRLFGNDAVKRRQLGDVSNRDGILRTLVDKSGGASCFCSAEGLLNGVSAPTEDAFVGAYNDTVAALAESGMLRNVAGVVGVSQASTLACEGTPTSFSSVLLLDLIIDSTELTQRELDVLGATFSSTYMELQTFYCDPRQQAVNSATFELHSLRRLGEVDFEHHSNSDLRWLKQVAATFKVGTSGSFLRSNSTNATQNEPSLFSYLSESTVNDTGKRYLQHRDIVGVEHRQLLRSGGTCLCSSDSVASRAMAPSWNDFVESFNASVVRLSQAGELPSVHGVAKVRRADIPWSSVPSENPSFSPTMPPSKSIMMNLCGLEVKEIVSILRIELDGKIGAINNDLLSAIVQEAYNRLRSSQCDSYASAVTLISPFARKLSTDPRRYLQTSESNTLEFQVTWNCAATLEGCSSSVLLAQEDQPQFIAELNSQLEVAAPGLNLAAKTVVVATEPPSSQPSLAASISPSVARSASPSLAISLSPSSRRPTLLPSSLSPTSREPTSNPTSPPTSVPPTLSPTFPPTSVPTTDLPTAATELPTAFPTTASPTTASPTTASPTTASPTTASPTTASPTTASPTTASPTTALPITALPTTSIPITALPTTAIPITALPTTSIPITALPTTAIPITALPTTAIPITALPTTAIPITALPTTASPVPLPPVSFSPIPLPPVSLSPIPPPSVSSPTFVPPSVSSPTFVPPPVLNPTVPPPPPVLNPTVPLPPPVLNPTVPPPPPVLNPTIPPPPPVSFAPFAPPIPIPNPTVPPPPPVSSPPFPFPPVSFSPFAPPIPIC